MKKLLLPLILLMSSDFSYSQIVNESVNFDQQYDLVNNFYGMYTLTETSSGGINNTGCLLTPDSNLFGNDNAVYCSKYKGVDGMTYSTRIYFYYADSLINPNAYDRAATIWLKPSSDPNHYIIAGLANNKKLELLSYYSADYSPFLTLASYPTWYSMTLNVTFNNDSAIYTVELVDMGPDGMGSLPVYIGAASGDIRDSVLARDSSIEVSFTGARYGGAIMIDDFFYSGVKSADSCISVGIDKTSLQEEMKLITANNFLIIKGIELTGKQFEIYDMNGRNIRNGIFQNASEQIDLNGYNDGIYLFNVSDGNKKISKKFLLNN